jgi:hypothetical protein
MLTLQRAVGLPQGSEQRETPLDLDQDTDRMCKNGAAKPSDNDSKDIQQSAETVNVGLINSSSTSFNKIPIWEIVEVVSLVILFILVIRWVLKFINKRKLAKSAKQARHIQTIAAQMRTSPLTMEMNEIQHPFQNTRQIVTKAITHRPSASLMELPIEATAPTMNNPTIGAYDQYR